MNRPGSNGGSGQPGAVHLGRARCGRSPHGQDTFCHPRSPTRQVLAFRTSLVLHRHHSGGPPPWCRCRRHVPGGVAAAVQIGVHLAAGVDQEVVVTAVAVQVCPADFNTAVDAGRDLSARNPAGAVAEVGVRRRVGRVAPGAGCLPREAARQGQGRCPAGGGGSSPDRTPPRWWPAMAGQRYSGVGPTVVAWQ